MGGPISFLLGLLMLGGSGASYAAENIYTRRNLAEYQKYWKDHPKVSDLSGLFREEFEGRMCSLGFGTYEGVREWIEEQPKFLRDSTLNKAINNNYLSFNEKYPQFQKKRFYGPFDLPKLRAELEPKSLYDLLYKWTVLEYGFWIYIDEEEWNYIDKYLWSGDYLYDKISWANFLVEQYPDINKPFVNNESETPSKFQEFYIRKGLHRFYECDDDSIHSLQWIANKHTFNTVYPYEVAKKDLVENIDEYIVGDIESELVAFLQQVDVRKEYVPLRFYDDNRFFSLLRESLNQPRYDISQISSCNFYSDVVNDFYYNDLPTYNYYQYVQMLHRNREQISTVQVKLKLSEEEFKEVFNDNHYLQMCEIHKRKAIEIAEKYEIEEFNLTKWDICQMTKARPTGNNYTIMREDPEGCQFIRECGWVPKYFRGKRFRSSDIGFLQQQTDSNKQEFCKLLRESPRFFIDFFKCVFVEGLFYEFEMDDLIKNAFEAADYPRKDEEHYKKLLQEAIDEYKTWVEIVDTTAPEKSQLKLRQPSVSQN